MLPGQKPQILGEIRKYSKLYKEVVLKHKSKNKLSSAEWFNCEHEPLSNAPDDTNVLDKVAPIELHFLFKQNIYSVSDQNWSEKVGVKRPPHYGGQFNGF